MSSSTLVILLASTFVTILELQFDNVIGLQFFMLFKSFPSFGSNVIMDSVWNGGSFPVNTLYSHDSLIKGPKRFQKHL
jgi:hypothetical protein